jgi:hypothetical protein
VARDVTHAADVSRAGLRRRRERRSLNYTAGVDLTRPAASLSSRGAGMGIRPSVLEHSRERRPSDALHPLARGYSVHTGFGPTVSGWAARELAAQWRP